MPAKNKSNEIRITRIFDAPVNMVWDAWTDSEQVAQWWGPRGFTLTTHNKDLRPGGIWHYTMHGPDGVDYPNKTHYLEVERYTRLVYDHGAYDDRPPLFRVTALFSEVDGKTKMDLTMALATPEAAEQTRQLIKQVGGNSTWDRLAEYVGKHTSGKEKFVINRSFDAPIDVLFKMWTDPNHFAQWLPPTGLQMQFFRSDISPGGSAFYAMTENGDVRLHGRIEYLDIRAPDRIVYIQQFCDEHENVCRHQMAPVWPESMLTTVELTEEGADQTRVTVTWEPHGAATREEIEAFIQAKGSMTQGWTGSFDKLDALLSDVSEVH
jgi:uncharacterized protein YndB with AHSA1/START domain